MYALLVLLQTLVLPLVSGGIHLGVAGGNPMIVFGVWWAFWGVGTRLLVAGISQLKNPERTSETILGAHSPSAPGEAATGQVVQELAIANLSFGIVALLTSLMPGWGLVGALPGALYLGLAGLRHLRKPGKGTNELIATWSDLLVFVVVLGGAVAAGVRGW